MSLSPNPQLTLSVGARSSPLSQAQVTEVLLELQKHHSHIDFFPDFMESDGDLDQTTSLRDLGKTDFFTRSLDYAQVAGRFRISIHSAKDLAEQLHPELTIIALTQGVDSRDALVLPEGETLDSLPVGAVIACSSERREEVVRSLRADLQFMDIRGSVDFRLAQLENGRIDGLVVAEAALLRLELPHLNRIMLPGKTTPLQGQLAIIARKDDEEMARLFTCLDTREAL